jgi:hypothetical protein
MCVIVAGLGNAKPSKAQLQRGCQANPDGFGWGVVVEIGGVWDTYWETTMDSKVAIDGYLKCLDHWGDAVQASAFHARIATHGTTTRDNCHPFPIGDNDQNLLFHNGILPMSTTDGRSDTRTMAEDILPLMAMPQTLNNDVVWDILAKWIGTGNKFVILSSDPDVEFPLIIVNEEAGYWDDDLWFSNSSCEPRRYTPAITAALAKPKNNHCTTCQAILEPNAVICDYCWYCQECKIDYADCSCKYAYVESGIAGLSVAWDWEDF